MRTKYVILVAITILAVGCGEPDPNIGMTGVTPPAPAAMTPQAKYDKWLAIVNDPGKNPLTTDHLSLAVELSNTSPELIDKMIDVLVDPATKVDVRFRVLDSISVAQSDRIYPRLLELTGPNNNPEIRAGVTMILAQSKNQDVIDRLHKLAEDPERRVRLSAMCGLTEQGDAKMRAALLEYYFTEGLPPEHRMRIIQSLCAMPQPDDTKVFTAAALDKAMPEDARMMAIGAFGRLGNPAAVATLEEVANTPDTPANLKQLATDAVKVINATQGDKQAKEKADASAQTATSDAAPVSAPDTAAPESTPGNGAQ